MIKVVSRDGEIFQVPEGSKLFDSFGREICDPTPVEVPITGQIPESLESMMMRMIHAVSEDASRAGVETLDEANDYEVDDEEDFTDMLTGHELRAMVEAREMKEEYPVDRSKERSGRASRDSEAGEEDGGDVASVGADSDDSRESVSKGVQRGKPRRDSRVAGGREDDSGSVAGDSADVGKGSDGTENGGRVRKR